MSEMSMSEQLDRALKKMGELQAEMDTMRADMAIMQALLAAPLGDLDPDGIPYEFHVQAAPQPAHQPF